MAKNSALGTVVAVAVVGVVGYVALQQCGGGASVQAPTNVPRVPKAPDINDVGTSARHGSDSLSAWISHITPGTWAVIIAGLAALLLMVGWKKSAKVKFFIIGAAVVFGIVAFFVK